MTNDNKIKNYLFKGLILFFVLIIIGYIFISVLKISIDSKVSYLYNYSQVISSIIACINLLALILFFYGEKDDKLAEEKRLTKSHWFNDFIYEKNIEYIFGFFNSGLIIVDEISNIDEADYKIYRKRVIKKFNELSANVSEFNNRFTMLIEIIDKQFYADLYNLLEEYEDKLKENLQNISDSDNITKKCNDIVNSYKKEFIKKIYDYTMKLS
ncbi:MAG: hypothetical protein LLF98_14255 [Clostridium sp.]|uniref:hypothetical protein n=1 Tax=Clostridium sp. TaxID=1506 RepID=UPI0025C6B332|nr:hypothetical protein [Clostridium sp.]MCE5222364.1 hypothetical protein [Clostridium sp.]